MRPVKKLSLKINVELEESLVSIIKKHVEDAYDEGCDYVYIHGCVNSECYELLELVSSRKSSANNDNYMLSPKLSKLLGLGIIYKGAAEGKEVDKFFESQMILKTYSISDEVYVFEGRLTIGDRSECVGLLLITDSGNRILLLDEVRDSVTSKKAKIKRKKVKRRRKRRKLKKKS